MKLKMDRFRTMKKRNNFFSLLFFLLKVDILCLKLVLPPQLLRSEAL